MTSAVRQSILNRSVRVVAVFELLKGAAALALAWGFVSILRHDDLHELAVALVGRLHLRPGSRLPELMFQWSDHLQEVHVGQVAALALLYAAMRLCEGWGLWHERRWAAWLAALSTAIYLPFELTHLLHKPGLISAGVLTINLAVLALMVWRLRQAN
jgi:uncharacterized membrane protein (DUF2068 family)